MAITCWLLLLAAGAGASSRALTMLECAIRWTQHHSCLDPSLGDKIIVGVSSPGQLRQNMSASRGGPLPAEVVEAIDAGYKMVKGREYHYARGIGVWDAARPSPAHGVSKL